MTKATNELSKNALYIEPLEDRMMLSAVQIFAAGATGQESFQLKVNDEVVATYENVGGDAAARQFEQFVWTTDEQILSADQIRIEFINDEYDPKSGLDRNLYVDKIRLDGVVYETESPSTFSTGLFTNGAFSGPGFFETEELNVNGSFFYSSDGATPVDPGTRIRVDVRGDTGDERIALQIDGITVQEFDLTTETQILLHTTSEVVTPDRVRVVFLNDLYEPDKGVDRNVIVDNVQLIDLQSNSRTILFADSPTTFSTGTYTAEGLADGFGRGNALHVEGYFQFGVAEDGEDDDELLFVSNTPETIVLDEEKS